MSQSPGTYFPCFSDSPRVSFLSLFIHKMHETGLLLYTWDSVKKKTWALQHFKEFPDGFLKQLYNTCMCSNHTALAWAAITHHLLVLQLCIICMCSNHAALACSTIIQYSHVHQSYITCMCNSHASHASHSLCLKAPQFAPQAAAEWFLSVPREAKRGLSQTVLQHTHS